MRLTNVLITGIITLGAAMGYAADTLPKPDSPFKGKIDFSRDKSSPDWPQRPTPALDELAKGGLRYQRWHVNSLKLNGCSTAAFGKGRNKPAWEFSRVISE